MEPGTLHYLFDAHLKNHEVPAASQHLFTDATVTVHGQEFQVHKHVLASTSPVFERMFSSEMLEGEICCTLQQIETGSERHKSTHVLFLHLGRVQHCQCMQASFPISGPGIANPACA